jgi:hypothetical protein
LSSQSTFPPDDDEDTIELELTPKEMRRLSRAARTAHASKGASRLWSIPLAAAFIGIVVGIAATNAWRPSAPHRVAPRMAPAPATRSTPPAATRPAVLAQPQVPPPSPPAQASQVPPVTPDPPDPPVRVRNPFDAHEVFEFPAGTTKAEARRRVSELLMQRAADRRASGKSIQPAD